MVTPTPQALRCSFWDLAGGLELGLSKPNPYPWIIELTIEF